MLATAAVAGAMLMTHALNTGPAPVIGAPEVRAAASSTLVFPQSWRVARRTRERLTLREGNRICQYTVTARMRIAAGEDPDAASRAAAALPAQPRYTLDTGTRNAAAWRVIRIPEQGRIHVEGLAVHRMGPTWDRLAGHRLWIETTVSAVSDAGDECHAGTWRDVAAPRIADALAVNRTRGYVRPR